MVKPAKWLDLLALIFSLVVIGAAAVWTLQNSIFSAAALSTDSKVFWHLTRSAGIGSYVLLLASMVWGLFISGRYVKDWSPGPLSLALHSTASWLALILGFTHALLLLGDGYYTYTLGNLLIPFTGPYRPLAVGIGIIAIWLILIINISFPLKRRMGHRVWLSIHMSSYGAFAMVTLHGLTAGTDGGLLGFRVLMGSGVVLVVLLLIVRMIRNQGKAAQRSTIQKAS